jgi:hypothetical protein
LGVFIGGGVRDVRALEVGPAILDLVAEPGQSITASFEVKNNESRPQKYYFSIQKFLPQGESGDQAYLPVTETSGLPSWTYLAKPSVLLPPGGQERVSFTIRVPSEATYGSAQETIFISTAAPEISGSGIGIGIRTGILVFVRIGAVQEERLVFSWIDKPTSWVTRLPVSIQTTIENQGGVYAVPRGELVVRNIFGRERTRIGFNPVGARILPGSRRSFSHVWQNHPPTTERGFWAMTGEELTNGGIGPYTIAFEPAQGSGLPRMGLFRVYVWPLRLIALIGGVLGVFLVILYGLHRRLIHRFIRASL